MQTCSICGGVGQRVVVDGPTEQWRCPRGHVWIDARDPAGPTARIAIVGSRLWPLPEWVRAYVQQLPGTSVVITGGAKGVDRWAEEAARVRGLPVIVHRAEWQRYGRAAGVVRNRAIVRDAEIVVAFWDGRSRGTAHTIRLSQREGKLGCVYLAPESAARRWGDTATRAGRTHSLRAVAGHLSPFYGELPAG